MYFSKLTLHGDDYFLPVAVVGWWGLYLALREVSSYFPRISREWKRRPITLMCSEVTGARCGGAAPETCGCWSVAGGCRGQWEEEAGCGGCE